VSTLEPARWQGLPCGRGRRCLPGTRAGNENRSKNRKAKGRRWPGPSRAFGPCRPWNDVSLASTSLAGNVCVGGNHLSPSRMPGDYTKRLRGWQEPFGTRQRPVNNPAGRGASTACWGLNLRRRVTCGWKRQQPAVSSLPAGRGRAPPGSSKIPFGYGASASSRRRASAWPGCRRSTSS
jgi:hypothetical protein